jgi:hypothetical protein
MSTDDRTCHLWCRKTLSRFADANGLDIVRSYEDEGKSGLQLSNRPRLRQLLKDVTDAAPFSEILVYDVSRWGRFQDVDAAAYHEYHCRLHGVQVKNFWPCKCRRLAQREGSCVVDPVLEKASSERGPDRQLRLGSQEQGWQGDPVHADQENGSVPRVVDDGTWSLMKTRLGAAGDVQARNRGRFSSKPEPYRQA